MAPKTTEMVSRGELRVAIVSTRPMGPDSAGGLAVRSLFAGWDPERLAQVYSPFIRCGEPDFSSCHDYRKLGWNGGVTRLQPSATPAPRRGRARRMVSERLNGLASSFRLQRLGIPIRNLWLGRQRYGTGLCEALASIGPDVVYAWPASQYLAKATLLACKRLDLPLVIHVVDDYVRTGPGLLREYTRRTNEMWLQRIADYATGHATIGPHMAEEYTRRYGHSWKWFTTLAEPEAYDPEPRGADDREPLKMLYSGNLTYGRGEVLVRLAESLAVLDRENIRADLSVYAPPADIERYRARVRNADRVTLQGWVSPDRLPDLYRDADILVHVESAGDAEYIDAIRLSLSTKISQYMMAGRCILGIGPVQLASMRFIEENGAGVVIGSGPTEDLVQPLRDLIGDRERVRRLGRAARERAVVIVDGSRQREEFRQLLSGAIRDHALRRDGATGSEHPTSQEQRS